jgi:long-chain acyl-CoA synthetase
MYSGIHALSHPDRPCVIMGATGETLAYREFDERANRLAHLLRDNGLRRGDHFALLMENHIRYLEVCSAGERSGLYYTPINTHLTADEVAYILENSDSRLLITTGSLQALAAEAVRQVPNVTRILIMDGDSTGDSFIDYEKATAAQPSTPIPDESTGQAMLYSSGTTGRPKGILRPMRDEKPAHDSPLNQFLIDEWHYREGMTFLSPGPLYHAAPQGSAGMTIRMGGTVVIMERFDAEQFLALVERYKVINAQMVPTMFSRLLRLPDEVRNRYDLSSLECVVHAAAPCPIPVKEDMIAWLGPIIHEYYGSTEGIGYSSVDSDEWLTHKGTVGRVKIGELHVLDDEFNHVPPGEPGTIYFRPPTPMEYYKDPSKTADSSSPDGELVTVGDVGYVDKDGWLYLTDRKTFMIVSGGVNIYPQETENLLVTHPKVYDVAVIGVPNADVGEEIKAVVQLIPGVEPSVKVADELIAFCIANLSRQKCPRSIDFDPDLPRMATGKLYKRMVRDRYWSDKTSRII